MTCLARRLRGVLQIGCLSIVLTLGSPAVLLGEPELSGSRDRLELPALPDDATLSQLPTSGSSVGVDSLQTAPDAKIDQLQPSTPPAPSNAAPSQDSTHSPEEVKAKLTDLMIQNALVNTATRYPWISDPTDRLTFSAQLFRPGRQRIYSSFDVQAIQEQVGFTRLMVGNFPKEESFYWILEGNRIVFETRGQLAGIVQQGRSSDIEVTQRMKLIQSYGGHQFVAALAPDMQRLLNNNNQSNSPAQVSSILTVTGEIVNPPGVAAPPVVLNHPGIDRHNSNLNVVRIPSQTTLFNNIDVANAPGVLQAFPTVNLQALAELALYPGEEVSEEMLQEAGITFGSPGRRIAPTFTPSLSSVAGIKTLQFGRFDNPDLLRTLLDRSLDEGQRKVHYLNSLYWSSFGLRIADQKESVNRHDYNWYRFYTSQAHNRVMIHYDPELPKATFSQVLSNPGFSLTLKFNELEIDKNQSLMASLGLLTGAFFAGINPHGVDQLLEAAREKAANYETFSPLQTKTTSEERRQINRRLNSTLAYTNLASGLEQTSGLWTFSGDIEPQKSAVWQLRSGLHRRSVLFLESPPPNVTSGPIRLGNLRLSIDRFGPLGFGNAFISKNNLSSSENVSYAVESLVTTTDGKQYLFEESSSDQVGVPIPARSTALAFDRLELHRTEIVKTNTYLYSGSLLLPAVEMVFSGTQGNLNYAVGAGAWLNFYPHQAINVRDNESKYQEPGLGLYATATVNYTHLNITRNADGTPQEILYFSPSLTLNFNSAANALNPNSIVLRSIVSYQNQGWELTVSPTLQYTHQWMFGLPASIRFPTGLNLEAVAEVGPQFYYRLEALQPLNSQFGIGLYGRNFVEVEGSRQGGYSYGIKLRYNVPTTSLSSDLTVGTSRVGLEMRLQGSLSF